MKHLDVSDYVGKVFGQLTIIRKVESKVREAKWFCLCSCGCNTIVATSKLKRGQTCCTECSRKQRGAPANFIDISGQKFGSLTVVKRGDNNKYGHLKWQCKCDCGNEIQITSSQLKIQRHCRQCWAGATYSGGEKCCSKCKKWKSVDSFPVSSRSASGRHSYCYSCMAEYRRTWLRNKFYGITDAEYNKAVDAHGGKCAMCGRYEELVIDHCHKTGKFRGLICRLCNGLLGRFKDSTQQLQNAIDYLNNHKNESIHSSN